MVIGHLQFGLVLIGLIVFVIDTEELEGVAVNLCLTDNVSHRHLDVRPAVAGVTHHDGNLLQRNALLREIRCERTPACMG